MPNAYVRDVPKNPEICPCRNGDASDILRGPALVLPRALPHFMYAFHCWPGPPEAAGKGMAAWGGSNSAQDFQRIPRKFEDPARADVFPLVDFP